MNYRTLLLIAAAGLATSGSSCIGPTVRPSLLPLPAPCLEDCKQYLDALPQDGDSVGRKIWELNAIWDYKACLDVQRECRRMLEENAKYSGKQ